MSLGLYRSILQISPRESDLGGIAIDPSSLTVLDHNLDLRAGYAFFISG